MSAASSFASIGEAQAWYAAWLQNQALPLWWPAATDRETGGFHEGLDVQGCAQQAPRRARVQGRQMFSYATAAQLGWGGPAEEAAAHGWDFLQTSFLRPDGLFRTRLTPKGAPDDERAFIYDQAFTLLGLAAACSQTHDKKPWRVAHSALADALESRRHPGGGYVEEGDRAFQANPHMHLFEACIAWMEQGEGRLAPVAEEIARLLKGRFVDSRIGALREFFDADWRPADGEDGRLVEPGHQFEWAWLLQRWAGLTSDRDAADLASQLFEVGRRGVDARGVVLDELWDDFSIRSGQARLWPQTEYLRAALALGRVTEALQAAATLRRYLEHPLSGAWFDRQSADGRFSSGPSPTSSFYHIVGAIRELDAAVVNEATSQYRVVEPID